MSSERCPGRHAAAANLALLALLAIPALGDEAKADDLEESPGAFQLGRDARWVFTLPAHLGPRGRQWGLAALGSSALLYAVREDVRAEIQQSSSDGRSNFLDSARDLMGKGASAPVVAAGALLASLATHHARERETAFMVLESAAFSAALAAAGSFVIAAERPRDGNEVEFLSSDGRGVSLDAALAASLVEPLRCQYLKVRPADRRPRRLIKRGASLLLYGGAALTALQRLDADAHWAPDAFLGSVTGLAVGKSLCQAHGKEKRGPGISTRRVAFAPLPGGALGVRIALDGL